MFVVEISPLLHEKGKPGPVLLQSSERSLSSLSFFFVPLFSALTPSKPLFYPSSVNYRLSAVCIRIKIKMQRQPLFLSCLIKKEKLLQRGVPTVMSSTVHHKLYAKPCVSAAMGIDNQKWRIWRKERQNRA